MNRPAAESQLAPAAALACEAVACALCGSAEQRPVLATRDWLHDAPGVFQIVRCAACGHLYESPRPQLAELERLYPADYAPHQVREETAAATPGRSQRFLRRIPGLRPLVRALLENRSTWMPPLEPGKNRIVELGCATGWFLEQLRARGWDATGVEPVAAPAEVARRRGFAVHVGSLESAGFPSESFDAACAWMVLEHLPDPAATLRELRRLLKPGGCLALSVPNAGCWERHVFGRYWYAWMAPVHFQHFTPRTLRRLLAESGFDALRLVPQASLLNVVGSLGVALSAWRPGSPWGPKLVRLTEDPPTWMNVLLAPAAQALAVARQSGRLTALARRPP